MLLHDVQKIPTPCMKSWSFQEDISFFYTLFSTLDSCSKKLFANFLKNKSSIWRRYFIPLFSQYTPSKTIRTIHLRYPLQWSQYKVTWQTDFFPNVTFTHENAWNWLSLFISLDFETPSICSWYIWRAFSFV